MSNITHGEFAARVLITVAIAALAVLLWHVRDILILIFGAIVLAVVLRSVMHRIERFTPLRGGWALLAAILALLGALALIGLLIGSRVSAQVGQLTATLPRAWHAAVAQIDTTSVGRRILHALQTQTTATRWLTRMTDVATLTVSALVDIGLILFAGLYFAANPSLYRRGLLQLVPLGARDNVQRALEAATRNLSLWLRGVLLSMLSIGVITGTALWLLGIPLALSLGIFGGLSEFIPYVGPIVAAVPALLVAFMLGPIHALEVLGLYLIVHLFEGELLVPMIQRWTVSLPPALGIIAVVLFGWLFGLPGILFATPLTVVLIELIRTLYVQTALKAN